MFWIEMLQYGSVVKVNKNLTYWRLHNASVTSKNILKGILAQEDKNIFDYIVMNYKLNKWQYEIALSAHRRYHHGFVYESDEIKEEVYKLWSIDNVSITNKVILWLISTIERHLSILI